MPNTPKQRCDWGPRGGALMIAYHDEEWGVPVHDDRKQFEFLTLESAQAGLSWRVVLRKREAYRRAFANFDPEKVAHFTPKRIERLLADPGIIRNRLKVEAFVANAKAFLDVQEEAGSFADHLWGFVDGEPVQNRWRSIGQVPAKTSLAETVSKDLKARGFTFVGPTIVYAFLQATGVVNDHLLGCFRHAACARLAGSGRGLSSGGSSAP